MPYNSYGSLERVSSIFNSNASIFSERFLGVPEQFTSKYLALTDSKWFTLGKPGN